MTIKPFIGVLIFNLFKLKGGVKNARTKTKV